MAAETDEDPALTEHLAAIWGAYQDARAKEGVALGAETVRQWPQQGEAWFALACCRERIGDLIGADRAFSRAAAVRDDPQPLPYRCSWNRFTRSVERARAALPARLISALSEVTLVLADYAEPFQIEGMGDPEIPGLCTGPTRDEVDQPADALTEADGHLSPHIFLFRRALEHNTSCAEEFDREVTTTLYHELGHYIGYDEDGLEELGLG